MAKRNFNTTGRVHIDRLLLILILPGLLSALWLAAGRHRTEARNRAVELTLDYNELQNLSFSSGTSMPQLMARFRAAGVTGVAVNEETIGDLVAAGEAKYVRTRGGIEPEVSIVISDKTLDARVRKAFSSFDLPRSGSASLPLSAQASPQTLNTIGIGLAPDAVKSVQSAGLDVVARLANSPAVTMKSIDASIAGLKQNGIRRVIFSGDEVLGFKGLVKYAADRLAAEGMLYGSIEFGKQKGDTTMSEKLKSDFIRVHSISTAEMATMTPAEMSERFSRAVKERSIRLCYLHIPELVGANPVGDGAGFINAVRQEIEKAGYTVGEAHTFGPTPRKRALLVLIALSIAAATVLLLDRLWSLTPGVKYGLLATGFLLGAGLCMKEKGIQCLALMSALTFPTLGVVAIIGPYFDGSRTEKSPVSKTVALFLGSSAVSLCGALCIVGLLADKSYMVKVNEFMGIKAAHGLPILAVVLFMTAGLPILGKPFSEVRRDISANIRRAAEHPLFVWHVIAVVVALGIIGFALLRTGNDSGLGVSSLELKFRAILDKILFVRPRTKEFLVGHPALFLGIACLLTRKRAWGLPLVALGMLGQVSLVNTFCHIHTPLMMSVVRVVNGLVLGVIFSLLLCWIFGIRRSAEKV